MSRSSVTPPKETQESFDYRAILAAIEGLDQSNLHLHARFRQLATQLEALTSELVGTRETTELITRELDKTRDRTEYITKELENTRETTVFLTKELDKTRERTEFIRDETLFELRKALHLKPTDGRENKAEQNIEPRVINHEKLKQSPLCLNIGCGHISLSDMVNVDARELPGVDVVADASDLPFPPNSVDKIHAAHLLEHFPRRYLLDVLLPHWADKLKPGGTLQLIVPDSEAMLRAHANGEMTFDDLALVTFGKQEYDGDFHYAMYTPDSLKSLIEEAGFTNVVITCANRQNGLCREMECIAVKGAQ